ncbi:MAG: rRNA maturation RNase YbeY [Candidatus Aminicenantia bacterium]
MVKFIKKVKGYTINIGEMRKVAEKILKHFGREEEFITVVFCGNRYIRKLNALYLSRNGPTDVISFSINEETEDGKYLGDIVISIPYALKSSQENKEPLENEIKMLIIHGILHLIGYDHERDSGEMEKEEERLRKTILRKK